MLKKIKKDGKEVIVLSLIIILILLVSVSADSYIIGSSYNSVINDSIKSGASKILSGFINLITGFFTINQIGFVSADSTNNYCCEKTLPQYGGNWCVDGVPQSECDTTNNYQSAPA